jgi:hypothetical protein
MPAAQNMLGPGRVVAALPVAPTVAGPGTGLVNPLPPAPELIEAKAGEATNAAVSAGGAVANFAKSQDALQEQRRKDALAKASRDAVRDPKGYAAKLVADRGWSAGQFKCLDLLWTRESGWNYKARNAGSGAYGIPQALPGTRMAEVASDWATNPVTQIKWGLNYISDRYGTPCGAWAHSEATGWY